MHVNALVASKHTKKDIPGTLLREVPENMHDVSKKNKAVHTTDLDVSIIVWCLICSFLYEYMTGHQGARSLNTCEKCHCSNYPSYSINMLGNGLVGQGLVEKT